MDVKYFFCSIMFKHHLDLRWNAVWSPPQGKSSGIYFFFVLTVIGVYFFVWAIYWWLQPPEISIELLRVEHNWRTYILCKNSYNLAILSCKFTLFYYLFFFVVWKRCKIDDPLEWMLWHFWRMLIKVGR